MQMRSWCLRVHRSDGERVRQELIHNRTLNRNCRIRSEKEYLLIPVTEYLEGAFCEEFIRISEKTELPRFEQVGGIAIMQDDDPAGAEMVLTSKSAYHTVLYAESAVEGEFRTKKYKVLAGKKTTSTEYIEYGHHFIIDLSSAYFSARLSGERQRILQMMEMGERVIDMFAGVGPFAITLAEKASVVYAGDLNPDAIVLMVSNIQKNHRRNVIPLLADALHLPEILPLTADRIIMNLPLHAGPFLPAAFTLCRPGGTIHLYALVRQEDELLDHLHQFPVTSISSKFVRSYSPDQFHVVYDITRGEGEYHLS